MVRVQFEGGVYFIQYKQANGCGNKLRVGSIRGNTVYHPVSVCMQFTQPQCVNHVETFTSWYNLYLECPYLLRWLKDEILEIAPNWPFLQILPHCIDKTDHHSITYTSNLRNIPGNRRSPSIICLLLGCILTRSSLIIKANITKASIWLVYAYRSVILNFMHTE